MTIERDNASNVTTIRIKGFTFLFSYETLVAGYIPKVGRWRMKRKWSRTTEKHINWFLGGQPADAELSSDEKEALIEGITFKMNPIIGEYIHNHEQNKNNNINN